MACPAELRKSRDLVNLFAMVFNLLIRRHDLAQQCSREGEIMCNSIFINSTSLLIPKVTDCIPLHKTLTDEDEARN